MRLKQIRRRRQHGGRLTFHNVLSGLAFHFMSQVSEVFVELGNVNLESGRGHQP